MFERFWNTKWFQPLILIIIAVIIVLIILRLAAQSIRSDISLISQKQDKLYTYIIKRDSLQHIKDTIQDARLSHFPELPLSVDDMTKVSSVFNVRQDPVTGGREFHTGVDYRAKPGTIVYAAASGLVKQAKWDGGYGNTIKIDHLNGYETTYAHLSNMTVIEGEEVIKGDTIGNVGSSGKTTGPHLHYEVSYTDTTGIKRKVNPAYFTQTATK